MEPVIRFRGAVALVGRFPALAGVDLDVGRGEIVLLQGPNGAGKTTLLRTCAGLLPVVSGEAVVLGHDLRRERRGVRAHVGLLGHASGLYGDLTVEENLRFWTRAAHLELSTVDEALATMGLDGRLRSVTVNRLSAGQRRRTSFACLLARRPELWLLDEPHAGLDNDARDLVDTVIRDAAAAGATVLVASHELERAVSLAERVVVVSGGMVTSDSLRAGDPGPLAQQPEAHGVS
ncbi:MAG: heme ABC exporter ATP-binding protein CcmA [Acidimicrobiales bacterium]|nr:heme ABC exporter ATP-binding protein CcmA [Acidimicrobiales bacterium]